MSLASSPAAADTDTIAAIATPLGEGGLAVLRISGARALAIADRVFVPAGRNATPPSAAPSHTLHFGHVRHEERRLDEALLAVMRAPRTFTREDIVEISCHGGVFVAREVLNAILAAGARLAHPGEFTKRAFLNGRIDLVQAEAVADLIHARTERALDAANEQLAGSLSRRVNALRDSLMTALAHIEAHIDFPDEDIAPDTAAALAARLQDAIATTDRLLATAREGRLLRRGIRAAIIGRPNAGKSSLLNHLLARERAIVSPIPGTTRDTIEETANVRGLPVVFVDTAGLRDPSDTLEEEGIRRTRAAAAQAELLLHVLDGAEPLSPLDRACLDEFAGRPRVLVRNKSDLPRRLELEGLPDAVMIDVSCATGEGIDALRGAIARCVTEGLAGGEMHEVTINARHEDALRRAREATARSAEALAANASLEFVALDLRVAVQAVGEVVGKTATDDLLDVIFSQFCLGK